MHGNSKIKPKSQKNPIHNNLTFMSNASYASKLYVTTWMTSLKRPKPWL